ncbi:hypothetical protein J6590_025216 [Homalodisca vitripennis]|nr:hypothetical protein J6590_025216 [Homalodisca vitripennis]
MWQVLKLYDLSIKSYHTGRAGLPYAPKATGIFLGPREIYVSGFKPQVMPVAESLTARECGFALMWIVMRSIAVCLHGGRRCNNSSSDDCNRKRRGVCLYKELGRGWSHIEEPNILTYRGSRGAYPEGNMGDNFGRYKKARVSVRLSGDTTFPVPEKGSQTDKVAHFEKRTGEISTSKRKDRIEWELSERHY